MNTEKKENSQSHKFLFLSILGLGALLRIYALGKVPGGYHMDEAFGAFNAYSLFHSGIDSAGYSFPVYLGAWDRGQNALNSYLMLPFLALFGGKMNPYVVRLPQVLVSVATLIAVFYLMKRIADTGTGLWSMFLLSVCPWHVMMSRWGLGANLAPGLMIIGLCFFAYGLEQPKWLIPSALFYGLSLYCYATVWLVVPLLLIMEWSYGFLTKTLKLNKWFFLHVGILAALALPLIAFLLVNKGVLPNISIGPFSVYRTTGVRSDELASGFSQVIANFRNLLYLLYQEDVGRPYEVIMPFGFFGVAAKYLVFLGVILLGLTLIYSLIMKIKPLSWLIMFQLIGALFLGLLVNVGITQINCIYIPLVLCGGLGITTFTRMFKLFHWQKITSGMIIFFLLFETFQFQTLYYSSYRETASAYFQEGSEAAVKSAMQHALRKNAELQIEDALKYPSVLLFAEMDAKEYLSQVEYSDTPLKPAAFYGKGVRFRMDIDWEHLDFSKVYLLYESDKDKFDGFTLEQFEHWYVAY